MMMRNITYRSMERFNNVQFKKHGKVENMCRMYPKHSKGRLITNENFRIN